MKHLLYSLVALLALAAPSPLAAQGVDVGEPSIMPGDSVRITVWRRPELSGSFLIATDGSVQHPLYRAVTLGGRSIPDAEALVGEYLTDYAEDPQFVLAPQFRVMVSGQVNRPGLYNFGPDVTLAQALVMAGGPAPDGRRDRAILLRDGTRQEIRLEGPGAEAVALRVRSGDQLMIEPRIDILRDYIVPSVSVVNGFISLVTLFIIL